MDGIRTRRREHYNLEKRSRKFNSWVASMPFEEYQADLFFFEKVRQRQTVP